MPTFYDALTGETRELNYHGIKCKREPDPMLSEVSAEFYRVMDEILQRCLEVMRLWETTGLDRITSS
jgi:hypothetical protein